MTQFKGTPGPWSVNEKGQHWNNKSLTHLEVIFGEDGECICDTVYQREDADLIAAAPELLEALQLAEKAMVEGRNVTYPEWYGVINKARAAIQKATGETK